MAFQEPTFIQTDIELVFLTIFLKPFNESQENENLCLCQYNLIQSEKKQKLCLFRPNEIEM